MAKQEEVGRWITIHGARVFIRDGENAQDAINRRNKEIADQNEKTKQEQIAKNKANADRLNGKTVIQRNAEALGLDYEKEGKKLIAEYAEKTKMLSELKLQYSKTHDENVWNKIQETERWLKARNKAVHEYKQKLGDKTPLW